MSNIKKISLYLYVMLAAILLFVCTKMSVFAATTIDKVTITEVPVFAKDAVIAEAVVGAEIPEGCVFETQWQQWDDTLEDWVPVTEGTFQEDAVYTLNVIVSAQEGYVLSDEFSFECTAGVDINSWWREEDEMGNATQYSASLGTYTFNTLIHEVHITIPEVKEGIIASKNGIAIEFRSSDEVVSHDHVAYDITWWDEDTSEECTDKAFEKEKNYQVRMQFKAGANHSFAEEVAVFVNGESDICSHSPKSLEVSESYSLKTPIESVEFTGLAQIEEGNKLKDAIQIVDDLDGKCEFGVEWCDTEDNSVAEENFIGGKTYRLYLDVNVFSGAPLSEDFVFIIDGQEYVPYSLYKEQGQAFMCIDVTVEAVKTYPLWVGGVQVTEENAADILGNGSSAVYDEVSNTLTLTDFVYSGAGYYHSGIYGEADINICLKGENRITGTDYYGILVKSGALNIGGDGTLDVSGTDYGIYLSETDTGSLTIRDSVTINAAAGDVVSGSSYGIRANGDITIQDSAKVNVRSGYGPARSCAIYAYSNVNIMDCAEVVAIGSGFAEGKEDMIDSYGIRTTHVTITGGSLTSRSGSAKYLSSGLLTQDLAITDGTLVVSSGTVTEGPSVGLKVAKHMKTVNSTIEAVGGDASAIGDCSVGIQLGGTMTVDGGVIKAESGVGGYTTGIEADILVVLSGDVTATAADAVLVEKEDAMAYSWGIQAINALTIDGGIVHGNGGSAADYSYGIQTSGMAYIGDAVVYASSKEARKSTGFWSFGDVILEKGILEATAGNAVSATTSYSTGFCSSGNVDVSQGGLIEAHAGNARGENAYSSAIEVRDNSIKVYDGYVFAIAGDAVGCVKAGSAGLSLVRGKLYTYDVHANVLLQGGMAEVLSTESRMAEGEDPDAEDYAYSNGIYACYGEVSFYGGDVKISAGSASGKNCDEYAIYAISEEIEEGLYNGGFLLFECDEVFYNMVGTPGLYGTKVNIQGQVLADMGIYIGEKLYISSPKNGTVRSVTDANGRYYTIAEEDIDTIAESSMIKPLGYTVQIYTEGEYSRALVVPAGKSVNEFYGPYFEVEDFGEMLLQEKEGYTFAGWYTDEAYTAGNEFTFDMPVTKDMTIYAKWTENVKPGTGDNTGSNTGVVVTSPSAESNQNAASQSPNVPLTGDNNLIWLWVWLMVCSFSSVVVLAKKKRELK